MHPLTQAVTEAVEEFSKNHQALRQLMVNTLVVIIEGKVGPLLAAAKTEANHLRFQLADMTNASAEAVTQANHLRCDLADETNAAQAVIAERDAAIARAEQAEKRADEMKRNGEQALIAERAIFNREIDEVQTGWRECQAALRHSEELLANQTKEVDARRAERDQANMPSMKLDAWNTRPTPEPRPVSVGGVTDEMVGDFPDQVRNFLLDELERLGIRGDIDGGGCDSGDWRDFVMSELRQGVGHITDRLAALTAGGDGWVSVKERMPDPNTAVMVCCMETDDGEGPFVASGFWIKLETGCDPIVSWQSQDSFQGDKPLVWEATHWRPLPAPPARVALETAGDEQPTALRTIVCRTCHGFPEDECTECRGTGKQEVLP